MKIAEDLCPETKILDKFSLNRYSPYYKGQAVVFHEVCFANIVTRLREAWGGLKEIEVYLNGGLINLVSKTACPLTQG